MDAKQRVAVNDLASLRLVFDACGWLLRNEKACEPIHAQYSYDDKSVVVVNTTLQPQRNLKLRAQVYDLNMAEKFSKMTNVELPADSNFKAFAIPEIPDLSTTYFLKLTLQDAKEQIISSNFYWLSTKEDVLDPQKAKWYYTPVSSYADMTQLQTLPKVKLTVSGRFERRGPREIATATVLNPSPSLAFFIRLQIKKGADGDDVLPILFQDNYFSLMPGESRTVTARYNRKDLGDTRPFLSVAGWNSAPATVPLSTKTRQ